MIIIIRSLQESWIARSATTTKNLLFVEGATDNDTKYLSREVGRALCNNANAIYLTRCLLENLISGAIGEPAVLLHW